MAIRGTTTGPPTTYTGWMESDAGSPEILVQPTIIEPEPEKYDPEIEGRHIALIMAVCIVLSLLLMRELK